MSRSRYGFFVGEGVGCGDAIISRIILGATAMPNIIVDAGTVAYVARKK